MKIKVLITSLLLSVFGFAYAGPSHELKPAHGGVIVEAKDIDNIKLLSLNTYNACNNIF